MKKRSLKMFCAFIMMMLSIPAADAQIIYTDVNPDHVVNCTGSPCSSSYNIDLNNDGINDFTISKGFNAMGSCVVTYNRTISLLALGSNAVTVSAGSSFPSLLLSGNLISPAAVTGSGGTLRHASQTYNCMNNNWSTAIFTGNWPGQGYAGLKLVKNGLIYYGWILLNVSMPSLSSSASCTVLKYACNSVPDLPIQAGEMSCVLPTVSVAKSGPLSFCNGDSVTFTANGTGYQYQWKKNNLIIAGATANKYTAKTAGVYKCRISNSCGSITSGKKTVTVPCKSGGESFTASSADLHVFPNPASNSVTIQFPTEEAGEISIVNLFGQLLYYGKTDAGMAQIDVSRFAAGLYVVKWISGENMETGTFSVIK